jgi:hypothetical protein
MSGTPRIASPKGTDAVQARYVITIRENGALSIEGPIGNKEYTLAVLENAKDAVRNHRAQRMVDVPAHDVSLEKS